MIKLVILLFSINLSAGEYTPVMFTDLVQGIDTKNARAWKTPDYSGQEKSLGYGDGAFKVPKGMEERVAFWLGIYTKYNTNQGVLHDSRYVNVIYQDVDFTDIMENEELNRYQKQKARERRVKKYKKAIVTRLKRLQKLKKGDDLKGEDKRFWDMFKDVNERRKFIQASKKGRLRFQLGQSDRFVKGIYFSGRYIEEMERIFKDRGLPIELTRLPFVESSFNVNARSRVGASGIWQFMRSTAKQYMRMNASADERNEPLRATESAAKKLRNNFRMLNDWPLAVTGYNHGPSGVRRLVRKYKAKDLVKLIEIRRGRFGFASANFYASFLAALEAEKNAKKYYGKVYWDQPLKYKRIRLAKAINVKTIKSWFNNDIDIAKKYNPHIKSNVWKGYKLMAKRNTLLVPEDKFEQVMLDMSKLSKQKLSIDGKIKYVVSRGDTLSEIAENFGVRLRLLKEVNGITNARSLRIGQKLIIPK